MMILITKYPHIFNAGAAIMGISKYILLRLKATSMGGNAYLLL